MQRFDIRSYTTSDRSDLSRLDRRLFLKNENSIEFDGIDDHDLYDIIRSWTITDAYLIVRRYSRK